MAQQLIQPHDLRANASQGVQRTNPNQAVPAQFQTTVVRERQLSSTSVTRPQRHASTERCPFAGRRPIPIRDRLNLDLAGNEYQCGSAGGWNTTPDVGTAQCHNQERHEAQHTDHRPRVHE